MQGSYVNAFEKVSRKYRKGQRQYNQGNPHRDKRRNKRQNRYS
tara:strand:+ start:2026 stop:2154 length:129 start_codon:yes stop_codon:yes gene_type:complete